MKTIAFAVPALFAASAALAQAPVAAPAAAPAAPPASTALAPGEGPPLARGGHAHLKEGAALRARSQADDDPLEGADATTQLTLKVVLKKDGLNWWYATSEAASGWVLDTDLVATE